MEPFKTKVTYGGEPGKNRADITEESKDATTDLARFTQSLVRSAGEKHIPIGAQYLGSATIFFYSQEKIASNPEFFVVTQLDVKNVNEHHADLGWKRLGAALMKLFGREEPKTRRDV